VISIASMVRSRAPTRYFTQSGIVGPGDGGGDDDSDEDSDDEGGVSSGDGSIAGDDLVVKALTALQAL